jgi:hypothetical protein
MSDQLFMFLAHGIAETARGFRPGARHALMIYATGPSLLFAQSHAVEFASAEGWSFVEPQRGKAIGSDTSLIKDPTLREAATFALDRGQSMVVYDTELPPDS